MTLREALRLIVITDRRLAGPRPMETVVASALEAGARAIQLRDKGGSARELLAQALLLRELTRSHGALLFVNDRFDVALAAGADGVHLGPDDLPLAAVRQAAPPGFLIGVSTDEPQVARKLESAGADYVGGDDLVEKIKNGWFGFDKTYCKARKDIVRKKSGMPQPTSRKIKEHAMKEGKSFLVRNG